MITGVSRVEGLGFAVARVLARRGFEVVVTARDTDPDLARVTLGRIVNVSSEAAPRPAATLPADGPIGGFFRDGLPLPW